MIDSAEVFSRLWNSKDKLLVLRAIHDSDVIGPYADGIKMPDAELREEIKDFNAFCINHIGEPVYDETCDPVASGIIDVSEYILDLGCQRWYGHKIIHPEKEDS